jgi:hypothetical protein
MSKETVTDLITIFNIDKKKQLEKHCRSITIFGEDFANLILACATDVLPSYHHWRHHREFQPEHLHLKDDDLRALVANGVGPMQPRARKTVNKVEALFEERRLLSGHIFFTADLARWHLFYFDQRDFSEHKNHWKGGAHIHLINHLWPGRSAQEVWTQFCTGNPNMRGAFHVRFHRFSSVCRRRAWVRWTSFKARKP